MVLKIIGILAVLIVVFVVLVAIKPNTFRIQRSIDIKASPDKVFALISDFHNWTLWAPQDKEDSTMKRSYGGSAKGEGAISEWNSSGSAGKGRMFITESKPPNRITINVDFARPFETHNVNEFTLEPAGDSTKVTWTMQGTNLLIMKMMGIFVNMDGVMGKHFDAGLNNLKALAEQ
jgi:carbon monoxide dehydrogenase subunit G